MHLTIHLPDDIAAVIRQRAAECHESPDAVVSALLRRVLKQHDASEDVLFARFVEETLSEWDSAEDNEAFRDL